MKGCGPVRTAALALLLAAGPGSLQAAPADEASALRRRAFEFAYNLDHDEALALLRRGVAERPSDPAAHRALASLLWLHLLFRRGAVTVDHYLGSFSRTQVELGQPPPDVDAEFRRHIARAIQLARERLVAAPRDPQAHYDLGAAIGLQASHTATVQGRLLAGFRAAQEAYDAHEKVLELDPSRKDAGLIVGTYRYVVSTLSVPLRMMAYVVGFGGGKERGIQLLRETAAAGAENRTDALFALALVYNRERRYDEALEALARLRAMYPRNRLVVLEIGATALRAGRAAQAEAVLTEGLAALDVEKRSLIPGEAALWRYKRGAARISLNDPEGARADLTAATAQGAQLWVSGRAHAELARLALRRGDREAARSAAMHAQALCGRGKDAACVEDARRLAGRASAR